MSFSKKELLVNTAGLLARRVHSSLKPEWLLSLHKSWSNAKSIFRRRTATSEFQALGGEVQHLAHAKVRFGP
ncbi:MAG: hypothetical protein JJD98_14815 [Polaromonas sp.]|nr:hypothetical protein [Polaromonas sp.]